MKPADIARLAADLAALNLAILRPAVEARGTFFDADAVLLDLTARAEKHLDDLSPVLLVALLAMTPEELRAWHAELIAPAVHARILQELDS